MKLLWEELSTVSVMVVIHHSALNPFKSLQWKSTSNGLVTKLTNTASHSRSCISRIDTTNLMGLDVSCMAVFHALYIAVTLSTLLVLWTFTLLTLLMQLFPGKALTCSDIPYIIQSPSQAMHHLILLGIWLCEFWMLPLLNYTHMNYIDIIDN